MNNIILKNYPAYYGVKPDFLNKGMFSVHNRNIALEWCRENCMDKFKGSDLHPWAFLSEADAKKFSVEFGGELKYKREAIC